MQESPSLDVRSGKNFSYAQVGSFTELDRYAFFHPIGKGRGFPGKLFLKTPLQLTGMEISLNKLPAGQALPFYHQHREHEELYLFLQGKGQFQIDDAIIDVQEGTTIRVAPEGVRTWRNHSREDLYYIVIQAKAGTLSANDIEDGVMLNQKVSWPG